MKTDQSTKVWNPVTVSTAKAKSKQTWGVSPLSSAEFHPERLETPLKRKKPTHWEVCSKSDLFHPDVTDEQIAEVWDVMAATPHHTYQILTKRPERMLQWLSRCAEPDESWAVTHNGKTPRPSGSGIIVGDAANWPLPNVWLGVSAEDQKAADERIPLLLQTPAAVLFLSCEPLLGYVNLSAFLPYLNWVIAGGGSGAKARSCDISWTRSIVQQCQDANVPVFVKQLGSKCYGLNHGYTGKGINMSEWPEDLRVREMPKAEVKA